MIGAIFNVGLGFAHHREMKLGILICNFRLRSFVIQSNRVRSSLELLWGELDDVKLLLGIVSDETGANFLVDILIESGFILIWDNFCLDLLFVNFISFKKR